jgi:hypothetical protein
MGRTGRDYAPKAYLDPVVEIEREALDKGFRRGVLGTVATFLGTYIVVELFLAAGRIATERLIPWLQAVL